MPGAKSFQEIVAEQQAALAAELRSQAEYCSAVVHAGLLDRIQGSLLESGGATEADHRSLRDIFHQSPPLTLVTFDTPGVHKYVFGVRRPVDIAGGSHLVAALTDPERAKTASIRSVDRLLRDAGHPPGSLIFAGGGRGLAIVASHRAHGLRTALQATLREATGGDLQTVCAELPVWPDDLGPNPAAGTIGKGPASRYGAAVSVLMGRLARERSRRESFGETVEGKARRCAACRRRVGTRERPQVGEWLCDPCSRRRTLGGRLKSHADEVRTFEELGGGGDGRMAVLYADGFNVGAAFQEVDSMARHRALSQAVDGTFEAAVQAILTRPELRAVDEKLLCQVPIRGGDDAILILPAQFALEAARSLCHSVESGFSLRENPLLSDALRGVSGRLPERVERFGVGVGIAIADCHFPVSFLVRYAEELLLSAKDVIHARRGETTRTPQPTRSAVDYLVLASGNPLSESIAKLRKDHFLIEPAGREPGLRLTERPFSIHELARLLHDAESLRQVPRSQLYALRQEVLRGFAVSRSLWRYQHARATAGSGWAQYREAHGVALADVDQLLWHEASAPREASGVWKSTSYLDALEILDLIPGAATASEDER